MFRGKNYKESAKLIDKQAQYEPQEAFELITKTAKAKFDETVELHVKLGVDSRHADQQVRGAIGLMPSPKAGTVTPNIANAIKEAKAGKIEYRLDKTNIIHCPIGKVSFGAEKLTENYNALIGAIIKAKPAAAKGQYIKSCVTASTMGPGIKIVTKI